MRYPQSWTLPHLNVAQPPHLLRRGIHVEEDALVGAGQRGAADQEDHQHEVPATVVGDISGTEVGNSWKYLAIVAIIVVSVPALAVIFVDIQYVHSAKVNRHDFEWALIWCLKSKKLA